MVYSAARRRELPPELPAAWSCLVTGLRDLKDGSGLTLAELARATAISRSSWERYLNGKQFPPRHAVQALCKAARHTEDELLAQWALADGVWSRRGQPLSAGPDAAPPPASAADAAVLRGPSPAQRAGRVHRMLIAASALVDERPVGTAAGVLLLCAAMVTPAAVVHASRTAASQPAARPPVCTLRSCEGRNPRTTACEDPVTTASHTAADGARLEIRLSPSCRAGWIRAWPTHPGFGIEITGPDARPQSAVEGARPAGGEVTTTTMIAAPHPGSLRACYYPSLGHLGRECFYGTRAP
ncbi:helix-turn-helix domain-containing protein [Streptomyces shenzhenensis]|uniref:helix-turn-helix domain-containing protein n=1 Tax=Streptomyces shenzhenensis TaxID=943815 RepID=UPI001F17E071|nr:helix-turn-helix domain-containing protein [Streptomyces shenzhenensis]